MRWSALPHSNGLFRLGRWGAGALGKLGRTGGPFALLGWRARNPVNAIHRIPQVAHAQDVTSFGMYGPIDA